jgi:hypothetical protein
MGDRHQAGAIDSCDQSSGITNTIEAANREIDRRSVRM